MITNEIDFIITLTDYNGIIFEQGTGTGSTNYFYDTNKNWTANEWVDYILVDSTSTEFTITANSNNAITITGTPASGTYTIRKYIANKKPIDLNAKGIRINLKSFKDSKNVPNKKQGESYSNKKGEVILTGIDNPNIFIDCEMDLDTISQTGSSNYKLLDFVTLFNLFNFNHTYYLKDYQGNDTTLQTPINALINNTDIRGKQIYDSKGMPVIISNITNIQRNSRTERGHFITFTMELIEDKD